jgi:hypothetical protein
MLLAQLYARVKQELAKDPANGFKEVRVKQYEQTDDVGETTLSSLDILEDRVIIL